MNTADNIAVHLNPVWRDRANVIIVARLQEGVLEGRIEQLWARQLDQNHFEICCIPFFVRDLDLGDHVAASVEGEEAYVIRKVVQKSGHYTFRVWFGETNRAGSSDEVLNKLEELGCVWEFYSRNLLGIDAASPEQAQAVADYLAEEQEFGHLMYETGRTEST